MATRTAARFLTASLLALTAATAGAEVMEALVPAYFYPEDEGIVYWSRMTQACSQIGVNAILNPNSGPGLTVDPNYVTVVNNHRAAGGRIFGYVYTKWGNTAIRPEAAVKADIDSYIDFYQIDGIFFDEMSTDPAHVGYYGGLYDYVKSKDSAYRVIGNPGVNTIEAYLTQPTADALVVFENPQSTYSGYASDSWNANYTSDRISHIVYSSASANLDAVLDLAQQRNAGLVYVTDDGGGNPYDTLPTYWEDEVAAIAAIPEPSMSVLGGMALFAWLLYSAGRKRSNLPGRT